MPKSPRSESGGRWRCHIPCRRNRGQLGRGAAAPPIRGAPRVTIPGNGAAAYCAGDAYARPGQCGVILRGELTVIAETGAQRMFRAGEGIVELVGTRHYGENRGRRGAGAGDVLCRNTGHVAFRACRPITRSYDDETNCANHYRFYPVAGSCGYRRSFYMLAFSLRPDARMREKECHGL